MVKRNVQARIGYQSEMRRALSQDDELTYGAQILFQPDSIFLIHFIFATGPRRVRVPAHMIARLRKQLARVGAAFCMPPFETDISKS